ncbi:hypothetical protein ACYX8G_12870 [Microbacterium saperdae]
MHRRVRLALLSATAAMIGLSLAACTPASNPDGAASPSPTVSRTPSPTPTPTPTDRIIEVSVDGLSIDGGAAITYRDPDGAVALLTDAYGSAPEEGTVDAPYGGVNSRFDWGGAWLIVDQDLLWVQISADAPGAMFRTPEGIGIGSTRAEAMAAGAADVWDEDGDGVADYLSIGMREVPDTQSLVHPGEVGVEYIELQITGDVVTGLRGVGNDFTDI